MSSIRLIQGGALQDRYRGLVLARARGPLTVRMLEPAPARERFELRPAAAAPLGGLLAERGLAAFLFEASELRADTRHVFEVRDGAGNSARLATRTLPHALPSAGLSVAVGSCYFAGFNMSARLGAALRRRWLGNEPLLQFWVGDNLYNDVPSYGLFSGDRPYVQSLERYLEYFERTGYADARAATPNYTTFDDHELWNNFPEPQLQLSRDDEARRGGYTAAALACLDLFQASLNPSRRPELFPPPLDPARRGRSFSFDVPPLSFFFLDVRSNRTRYSAHATMLHRDDLAAFEAWVERLSGPGVLALGQPLWTEPGSRSDYNVSAFRAEYQRIWAALERSRYDMLAISGDVHHSRVLQCSLASPNRFVYEVVTSPASHIPTPVTSVLPWHAQGRGKMAITPVDPGTGQRVKASYYFGTSAPNTIAVLDFAPAPSGAVHVGVAFVDYGSGEPALARAEPSSLPAAASRVYASCASARAPLFTLKRRPPRA